MRRQDISRARGVVDLRDWTSLDVTGNNDSTGPFQAAVTQAVSSGFPISVPPGIIAVNQININNHGVTIRGAGRRLSRIKFVPTANGSAAFDVAYTNPATNQLNDFFISDLGIYSPDLTYSKAALRLTNCSKTTVERVDVWGPTFGSNHMRGSDSVGFHIKGREQLSVRSCRVYAAVPIYLDKNPSNVGGSYDTDSFNFHNIMLASNATAGGDLSTLVHALILIANTVRVSPLSFTGYQAWVAGLHGLYWDNPGGTAASAQIYIENMLSEQGVNSGAGWSVYINGGPSEGLGLGQLTMVNCQPETSRNGVKLARVGHLSIIGGRYGHTTKRLLEVEKGTSVSAIGWQTVATATEHAIRFPDGDYFRSAAIPNYGSTAYIPSTAFWLRNESSSSSAATTLTVAANAGDTVLTVDSIADSDFQNNAPIRVALNSGRWHVTTINGTPVSSQITLRTGIPAGEAASIGNQVVTNRVMSSSKDDFIIGDGGVMVRRIALYNGQTYRLPLNKGNTNVEQCILEVQAFDPVNNELAWGSYALTAAAIGTNGITLRNGSNAIVGSNTSAGQIGVYAETAALGADIRVKSSLTGEAKILIKATVIRTRY
jgi:hypothetical protein